MIRKIYIFICSVAAVLVVVWFFSTRGNTFIDTPRSGTNIIFFGDSLVEGVGVSPGSALPALLSQVIGFPIINAGKSGDTTQSALGRLESDVLNKDPRVVIILLGGNDSIRKVDPEQTFANLRIMIDAIHAKGAAVLLVGIRGPFFGSQYDKAFEGLAKETRVSFVPDILDGIAGRPSLMSDLIHPNDAGYGEIAKRITPILQLMIAR